MFALTNPDVPPGPEEVKAVLRSAYDAFVVFSKRLQERNFRLEKRYDRDGKSWMGKITLGVKIRGWVYPYDGYFTVTRYASAGEWNAAAQMKTLSEPLRKNAAQARGETKLLPVCLRVRTEADIALVMEMLSFVFPGRI